MTCDRAPALRPQPHALASRGVRSRTLSSNYLPIHIDISTTCAYHIDGTFGSLTIRLRPEWSVFGVRFSVFSRPRNRAPGAWSSKATNGAPTCPFPLGRARRVGGKVAAEALAVCAGHGHKRGQTKSPVQRDISPSRTAKSAVNIGTTKTCERRRGRQRRVVATSVRVKSQVSRVKSRNRWLAVAGSERLTAHNQLRTADRGCSADKTAERACFRADG